MSSPSKNTIDISKVTDDFQGMEVKTSKRRNSPGSKSPTLQTSLGRAHVYYIDANGIKVFLGSADDRTKLTHFSSVARQQLISYRYGKIANMGASREVVLSCVDYDAGRLVLRYINDNDIHKPKPLYFDLLGTSPSFPFACKVHHATNVFRIGREVRGNELRGYLLTYIHRITKVTFAEFQVVCETLFFDSGLMKHALNKVAFHTLKGWIEQDELAQIDTYCRASDAYKNTNLVEQIEAIFQLEMKKEEAMKKAADARAVAENLVVVNASVAGMPLVLSSELKKVTATQPAGEQSLNAATDPAAFDKSHQRTSSKDIARSDKNHKKAFGNVGGKVGAIKAAPGLAQLKAKSQNMTKEVAGVKDDNATIAPTEAAAEIEVKATRKISYAKMLGS